MARQTVRALRFDVGRYFASIWFCGTGSAQAHSESVDDLGASPGMGDDARDFGDCFLFGGHTDRFAASSLRKGFYESALSREGEFLLAGPCQEGEGRL